MELGLSLGDTANKRLSILMDDQMAKVNKTKSDEKIRGRSSSSSDSDCDHHPPLQLDLLLPLSSVRTSPIPAPQQHHHHLSFSWLTNNLSGGVGCLKYNIGQGKSRRPLENLQQESRKHELIILERGGCGRGRASEEEEEEEGNMNGIRKKLRLTKDQSAFLEDSFKDHNTLNPKQKVALAKQLKLRPRQVEVWFQNRRARTKLKQTEVDCEYLKRCCEKLTEENRKLQKEVQELRALKQSSSQPFYMQLPPTTLTMCPSCERTVAAATSNAANTRSTSSAMTVFLEAKPIRSIPFSPTLAS